MSYEYICQYCDYKWTSDYKLANPRCSKCKDKNLKIKKIDKSTYDVFGYNEEENEEDTDNWFSKTIEWGAD